MESIFHTLRTERVHHRVYATRDRARRGLHEGELLSSRSSEVAWNVERRVRHLLGHRREMAAVGDGVDGRFGDCGLGHGTSRIGRVHFAHCCVKAFGTGTLSFGESCFLASAVTFSATHAAVAKVPAEDASFLFK